MKTDPPASGYPPPAEGAVFIDRPRPSLKTIRRFPSAELSIAYA